MAEDYEDLKNQEIRRRHDAARLKEERQKTIHKRLAVCAAAAALIIVLAIVLLNLPSKKEGSETVESEKALPVQSVISTASYETEKHTEEIPAVVTETPQVTASEIKKGSTPDNNDTPSDQSSSGENIIQEETEVLPETAETPEETVNSSDNPAIVSMPGEWSGKGSRTRYTLEDGSILTGSWQNVEGNTYHFNSYGYLDLGWKMVDGKRCYFDDSGIYIPDAVPGPMIAFTFDDGPSQGMDQLLGLCDDYGARVTFFMIGAQVETGGGVIPFILDYRCELGNHSYSHGNKLKMTTEECVADFEKGDEYIMAFSGGIPSALIRFPYGDFRPEEAASVGKPSVMWSIDTLDWKTKDENMIYNEVMSQIEEGDIILMHDRYDATVNACRRLFPELISSGYQLVTVSELAASKGIEMQPGVAYYSFSDRRIADGTICS